MVIFIRNDTASALNVTIFILSSFLFFPYIGEIIISFVFAITFGKILITAIIRTIVDIPTIVVSPTREDNVVSTKSVL